jgi:uncharacterized protein YgiM (DUF1202 family)
MKGEKMSTSFFVRRIATLVLLGTILLCATIPCLAFAEDRDTRYLQPGEVANNTQNASSTGVRDMAFLLPSEVPTQSSQPPPGARDMSFMTPDEASAKSNTSGSVGFRRSGSARIGNCREWINVRNDPSTKNKPIGRATKGAEVNVLYWSNDGVWAYAKMNDTFTGWIHGQFVIY